MLLRCMLACSLVASPHYLAVVYPTYILRDTRAVCECLCACTPVHPFICSRSLAAVAPGVIAPIEKEVSLRTVCWCVYVYVCGVGRECECKCRDIYPSILCVVQCTRSSFLIRFSFFGLSIITGLGSLDIESRWRCAGVCARVGARERDRVSEQDGTGDKKAM